MLIDDDKLRGKKVLTANGRHIGEVVALEIEMDAWQVSWFDVKLLRDVLDELKVKKPLFGTQTARIAPRHLKSVSDAVLLALDMEQTATLLHQSDPNDGVELRK